jgi:hypothetical protein
MSRRRILRGTGANNLKAALRCRLSRVGLWGTAHPPPLPLPFIWMKMREGMRCHRQTQLPKKKKAAEASSRLYGNPNCSLDLENPFAFAEEPVNRSLFH